MNDFILNSIKIVEAIPLDGFKFPSPHEMPPAEKMLLLPEGTYSLNDLDSLRNMLLKA